MAYLLSIIAAPAFTPTKKAPAAARAMTIPLFNCSSSSLKVFIYNKSRHQSADLPAFNTQSFIYSSKWNVLSKSLS